MPDIYDGLIRHLNTLSRKDSADEHWITMNGSHILIEGHGPDAKIKAGAGGKFNGQRVKSANGGHKAMAEYHETQSKYHKERSDFHKKNKNGVLKVSHGDASAWHQFAALEYKRDKPDEEKITKYAQFAFNSATFAEKNEGELAKKSVAEPKTAVKVDKSTILSDEEYSSMTKSQHAAVYKWRSEAGYKQINNYLSSKGTTNKAAAGAVKELTKMIESHKSSEPKTLFRGVNLSSEQLAGIKKGGVTEISKGFIASAPNEEGAREYLEGSGSPVMFKIEAPVGTKMLDILSADIEERDSSLMGKGNEIVMPPGTKFKVKSIEDVKDNTGGFDRSHTRIVVVPE